MAPKTDPELIELRKRMRHSAAHVMADIVTRLHPEIRLGIGPPTDDGFYYDFLADRTFSPDELEDIEKRMQAVIDEDLPFVYAEYSRDVAKEMNSDEPLGMVSTPVPTMPRVCRSLPLSNLNSLSKRPG